MNFKVRVRAMRTISSSLKIYKLSLLDFLAESGWLEMDYCFKEAKWNKWSINESPPERIVSDYKLVRERLQRTRAPVWRARARALREGWKHLGVGFENHVSISKEFSSLKQAKKCTCNEKQFVLIDFESFGSLRCGLKCWSSRFSWLNLRIRQTEP